MKKLLNKKGFTIVELVIVIAVIGILAAVLIPTFSNVIDSAKESAALQEAKNELNAYNGYVVGSGNLLGNGTVFVVGEEEDDPFIFVYYNSGLQNISNEVVYTPISPDEIQKSLVPRAKVENAAGQLETVDLNKIVILDEGKGHYLFFDNTKEIPNSDGSADCKIYAGVVLGMKTENSGIEKNADKTIVIPASAYINESIDLVPIAVASDDEEDNA